MNGKKIKNIINELNNHKPIIFGTDTINGIGCIYNDIKAIKRIFTLKNRDEKKPLVFLFNNLQMVEKYAFISKKEKELIKMYMPGALTLIVFSKKKLNELLLKNNKIAIRIPGRKSIRDLIEYIDKPLATTSLNLSESAIMTNRKDIHNHFPSISIYNNISAKRIPSTIIEVMDNDINIIRKGKLNIRRLGGKD